MDHAANACAAHPVPKEQTTASKKARTDAREGEKFTTAYRRHDRPQLSPAELLALGVTNERKHTAKYVDDEWGWDARTAQNRMHGLQVWEEQRAGRDVRIWSAVIEARAAALDEDNDGTGCLSTPATPTTGSAAGSCTPTGGSRVRATTNTGTAAPAPRSTPPRSRPRIARAWTRTTPGSSST